LIQSIGGGSNPVTAVTDSGHDNSMDGRAGATSADKLIVVGVGSSAGGLEALTSLVHGLEPQGGFAYVVAQHLAPQHRSMMVELLGRASPIPVVEALDGEKLRASHVFIAPPNKNIAIDHDRIVLSETFADGPKPSIDSLFSSLAETVGSDAVGIILSGTGSDGARGVRAIHAAGGLTIAQESQSAKYPSMPEAAVRSGVIDLVLRPDQIGAHLRQIFNGTALGPAAAPAPAASGFAGIIQLIQQQSGIDFRLYKQGTLTRRIERRLRAHGLADQDEYLTLLERNGEELSLLVGDILVSVTSFFRDAEAFEALGLALSDYLARKPAGEPIRAWIPGCATGEEAYSVAMVIADALRSAKTKRAVQIFAVDVDEHALETARRAVYPAAALNDIPPRLRKRYVQKLDTGEFRIAKEIRDMVLFSRLDITRDPPFSRIDLISCRNLLIYFDNELQERTMNLFQYALTASGILMLGRSETVNDGGRFFDVLDKTQKLYTRKPGVRLPLGRPTLSPRLELPNKTEPRKREWALPEDTLLRGLTTMFAPAAVLIDEADRVMHATGDLSGYLTVNPGRFNQDLLSLVVPSLRAALRSAIYRATHNASGRSQFVWKESAGRGKKSGGSVRITVAPASESDTVNQRWRIVAFERIVAARLDAASLPASAGGGGIDERVVDLENELAATREHLQTVIQELENANEELQAANEELQSANEELQATNEELETSNEELQATNEELETINEELRVKTDELAEKAADLDNVLRCAPAATIVTDRDLRIRVFNQAAQRIFRITASDIGHVITQVPSRIEMVMIREKLLGVMETGIPFQRDVVDENGRYYEKIIAPYFDAHQQVAGAILTLTDITDRAEDQRRLREATRQLKEAQRIAHVGDWRLDVRNNVLTWSEEIFRLHGLEAGGIQPTLEAMLACYPEADRAAIRTQFDRAIREGKEFAYETRVQLADGVMRDIAAEAFCEFDAARRIVAVFGVMRDRTADLAIQTALDDSQRRLKMIIDTIVEGVIVTDRDGRIRLTNRAMERSFGYEKGELEGKNINILMPDTVHRHHDGYIRRYHDTQQRRFTGRQQEVRGRRKDGSEVPIEIWVEEVIDQRSSLMEDDRHVFIATVHDITPRKAYEDALIQAKRAAEAANEAKSIFLAEMSHELRTPLNAIIGFSEMIKDQLLGPITNPKYRQYGADIYSSGKHLLDIISDILDLSSVEAGKFKIEDGVVDVGEALSDCIRLVENGARAREISIQLDSAPRMPKLRADPRAFRQILINLLSNAVKFTPAQGKVLASARFGADEGFVITIADTGIGMTEEEIENAFKPFGRVDNERIRDVAAGTGLGLPITKSLVEMHGGTLKLEGAANKGTTAIVIMPANRVILDNRRR
jgi:two-component system CheB/CheR fusion protein